MCSLRNASKFPETSILLETFLKFWSTLCAQNVDSGGNKLDAKNRVLGSDAVTASVVGPFFGYPKRLTCCRVAVHLEYVFFPIPGSQLMVNWWFGARWFGFLGFTDERKCVDVCGMGVPPESQTNKYPLPSRELTYPPKMAF